MADPVVLRYWEELYHYSDGYKGCYNSTKANVNRMKIYLDNCSLQRPFLALKVLYREIGIVNTVRFINQFTTGYGNYTQEREQILKGKMLDDIVIEIKKLRK